jgi:HEAT repeat protein
VTQAATLPQRRPNGQLMPGFTANPLGRPKVIAKIQALARQHTEAAIARIVELLRSPDEKVALAAASELLDRGYGKPMQQTQSDVRKLDMSPFAAAWVDAMKGANGYADPAAVIDADATEETTEQDDGAALSSDEAVPEGDCAAPSEIDW